jgi:alpha-tubulin suppressor-like RCC1 family protein
VGALTDWSYVSSGSYHIAAVKTDGTLWAWGNGGSGRLGDDTVVNKSSPVQIGALTTWSQVSAAAHTVALRTDGTLWAWGLNASGQLGDGTVVNRSSPVQIGLSASWYNLAQGSASQHTAAIFQGSSN